MVSSRGWYALRTALVRIAGACGCDVGGGDVFRSPAAPPDEPIVCTANRWGKAAIQTQIDGYRAAFQHLAGAERIPDGFRWRFRPAPGLKGDLKTLAEHEHDCCRFFRFDVFESGGELVWETRAAERAAAITEEYFHLPERLRAEARPGHDLELLKRLSERAGLSFSMD